MRDPSDMATMPEQRRNTTPLQRPDRFGDVVHIDIFYGSRVAIEGYRYTLWFVDILSKNIEQYPLNSLASNDLLKYLRLFRRDMGGRYPNKMMGDRNFKLIGDEFSAALEVINEYREEKDQSVITGAPAGR